MTPTVKSFPAFGFAAALDPVEPADADADAEPAGADEEPAGADEEPAGADAEPAGADAAELADAPAAGVELLEHDATSGITAAAVTAATAHLRWNSFTLSSCGVPPAASWTIDMVHTDERVSYL